MNASKGGSGDERRPEEPTQLEDNLYFGPWHGSSHPYPHLATDQNSGFEPTDAGMNTFFGYANPWSHSFIAPPPPSSNLARTPDIQERNIYEPPNFNQAHQWISPDISPSAVPQMAQSGAPFQSSHNATRCGSSMAGPTGSDNPAFDDKGYSTKDTEPRVVKVYACFHEDCPFIANSRRDVRRHLQSDKHRKDHVEGLPSEDRFYCEVPDCEFANKGFSRRDNMLRHMLGVHGIELDREKPGRKKAIGG
ncbi:hypothetical protein GGR58DRAFT_529356 [Xylaria digitata]|nr:hypothetical protein GGR58DRAFT_529356 [Xylaria digitata]